MRNFFWPLAGAVVLSALSAQEDGKWNVVKNPPVDLYKISAEVKTTAPLNFGVNLRPGHFKPWYEFRFENLYNAEVGFEPILSRSILTLSGAENCTPTRIEEKWEARTRPGFSGWGKYPTGWWDGADLVIYRIKDGAYDKIHQCKVKKHVGEKGVEEWIELEKLGPVAQNGDILVFTKEMLELPYPDEDSYFRKRHGFFMPTSKAVKPIRDMNWKAPENGGKSSLKISLPGGKEEGMSHYFMQNRQMYLMIPDGTKMRCELWMRQEGMSGGKVKVSIGKQETKVFDVGADWKKYSFDFVFSKDKVPVDEVSEEKPKGTEGIRSEPADSVGVSSDEKGTLWIDNFVLYESAQKPFSPRAKHLQNLKSFKPGTIRFWDGSGINRHVTLENWLASFPEMMGDDGMKGVFGLPLGGALDLCKQCDSSPWLALYPLFTDEEILGLMEYLAAPADKGYGRRRAADGRQTPWLDEFKTPVMLECGNETWNTIFGPQAWSGKPEIYAAVAERMFRIIKSSPYYDPDKFRLVACGWSMEPYRRMDKERGEFDMSGDKTKQWSFRVAEGAKSATAIDAAWYYGGADGVTVLGENDRELYAKQLFYAPWICAPQAEAMLKMRQELFTAQPNRTNFDIACYEGGPGYPMPSAAKPYSKEGEIIGKSLVSGLVTLDAFLFNQSLGFTSQNFYEYGIGTNFTSHTAEDRPIPAWISLSMRNNYCKGAMLDVMAKDVKTFDIPDSVLERLNWRGVKMKKNIRGRKGVTATTCYAFQNGNEYSFLLLNRLFDEERKIRLEMPFNPAPEATAHMLAHKDPRAHNRFSNEVKESERSIGDFKNGYEFILPPSSIIIINARKAQ